MDSFLKNNRAYFACLMFFIVAGGAWLLATEKVDALYFFSNHRSYLASRWFSFITHFGEATAYFAAGLIGFAIRPRYGLLIGLTGLTVLGLSRVLKLWFAVDRPLAFFTKENLLEKIILVEGIDVHTGPTSFPSGHSMSAFALCSLLCFLLPQKKGAAAALFVLAFMVGLSRVYLVQHYFEDVFAGALIGSALAILMYGLHKKLGWNEGRWTDRRLISRRKA